jgi:hypothetical protein
MFELLEQRRGMRTIHTARFGGLFSDGGSQVAGNLRAELWMAAPGERL